MYRIDVIIDNLINKRLTSEEVNELIPKLIKSPGKCPCMMLRRHCNTCKYKTINQEVEGRYYSGCIAAVEYFAIKSTINNFDIKIEVAWKKILFDALADALERNYPKLRSKVGREWIF